jgi:hypothetical protein
VNDSGYGHQHQQQQHQQLREQYQNVRSGKLYDSDRLDAFFNASLDVFTGSSVADNTGGPRRVTMEEREKEEREMRAEYKSASYLTNLISRGSLPWICNVEYRREAEEAERKYFLSLTNLMV